MRLKPHGTSVYIRYGRKLFHGLLLALVLVLLPIITGVGTAAYKVRQIVADSQPTLVSPLPAIPTPDPSKLIAVVLLSNDGTEITDTLPPYELLAVSGAFNTFLVAPERRVSPITTAQNLPGVGQLPSGLEVLPHYGYADYDRLIGRDPDLIIIPYFTKFVAGSEQPVLEWIRAHAGSQTTILSICAGSRVLVETGLLDGHAATGLHQDLAGFQQRYPAVHWRSGVRWVDDRKVITSGTLSTGIDATLHTIERLAGRDVAERAGQALGYQHLDRLDDPTAEYRPPSAPDLGLLPNAMYSWGQTDVGVILHEGISETALAALLDTAALNLTHSYTLASERTFVRSRHGMIMAPRLSYADAPALDRVVVLSSPGDVGASRVAELWNQRRARPPAELLTAGAGADFAYDAIIADIARREGAAVARSDSINLVYPVHPASVHGPAWTVPLIVRPLAIGVLGLMLIAIGLVRRSQTRTLGQSV
jgi:putative intracellular protease/amidase